MIKVVSYMKCIPPGNKKPQKPLIIKNFIEGVNAVGDKGLVLNTWSIVDADVAVIQGFTHQDSQKHRHLILRKAVYDRQQQKGKRTVIVDSSLFLFADPTQSKNYLRYGYDGIFPNTAEYCWDKPDPMRWEEIKKNLKIDLQPWRLGGGAYVLICCQRDGGWSMRGTKVLDWLLMVVQSIRKVLPKKLIRVRFHPGDKNTGAHIATLRNWINTGNRDFSNVEISGAKDLKTELVHAQAVIGHNSSPTVASVIEGIPTLVTDPERAQAKDVCMKKFEELDNPQAYDRELWIRRIAQTHWTLDEVKQGLAWKHMRKYVK